MQHVCALGPGLMMSSTTSSTSTAASTPPLCVHNTLTIVLHTHSTCPVQSCTAEALICECILWSSSHAPLAYLTVALSLRRHVNRVESVEECIPCAERRSALRTRRWRRVASCRWLCRPVQRLAPDVCTHDTTPGKRGLLSTARILALG